MFVIYPVLVMIDKPRGMIATASFGICQPLLRRTEAAVASPRDGVVATTSVLYTRGKMGANLTGFHVQHCKTEQLITL